MSIFTKTVSGASTFHDGNTLNYGSANITVEGSSTAVFNGLVCTGDVTLNSEGQFLFGSTLVIDTLKCKNATINLNTSSTIDIKNIQCSGTVTINVHSSSTLRMRAGSLNIVNGVVNQSSTGVCRATIKQNNVETASSGTFDAG